MPKTPPGTRPKDSRRGRPSSPETTRHKIQKAIDKVCDRIAKGDQTQNDVIALRTLIPAFTPLLSAKFEQSQIDQNINTSDLTKLVVEQLKANEPATPDNLDFEPDKPRALVIPEDHKS